MSLASCHSRCRGLLPSLAFCSAIGTLLVVLLGRTATSAGVSLPGTLDQGTWLSLRGGFHHLEDLTFAPNGQPWACGTGVVTDTGTGWRVTEWIPGRFCVAIEMDGPSSGWVLTRKEYDITSPGPHLGAIHRLRGGRVTSVVDTPEVEWLDLAQTSASDMWATGRRWEEQEPVFYHFDGHGWHDRTPEGGPWDLLEATIKAVDMLSPDLGFAVSSVGAVWRWDGVAWQPWNQIPDLIAQAEDIFAVGDNSLWIVGGSYSDRSRYIAHLDDQEWEVKQEQGGMLYSIAMASPNHGWIVGENGEMLVLEDGDTRSLGASMPTFGALSAVEVAPDGERALAVADSSGQVVELSVGGYQYAHGGCFIGRSPIAAAAADGHGGAWTGGGRCVPDTCWPVAPITTTTVAPLIWHWSVAGNSVEEQLPELEGNVSGLSLRTADDVWAVGGVGASTSSNDTASGFVLRREEGEWRQIGELAEVSLRRLSHGADQTGWAIGNKGYNDLYEEAQVVEIDEDNWQVRLSLGVGTRLSTVKANSADDVWVAGARYEKASADAPVRSQAVLRHFDGQDWLYESIPAKRVTALDVLPSGRGWAGGSTDDGWALFERLDGQWVTRQQVSASIRSLRLLGAGDGYAGTGQGQILRLADGRWQADWTEPNRFTNFEMGIYDFAVLRWGAAGPVVLAAGHPETLIVRLPPGEALLPEHLHLPALYRSR